MKKIILSADSTCDLGEELIKKLNIDIIPLHITLGEKTYRDSIDIDRQFIFDYYDQNKVVPSTSAPNIGEYIEHFSKYDKDKYDIIHFSISSALSSSYQNSVLAKSDFNNVYCIDAKSISIGIAILIIKAHDLIKEGKSSAEIYDEIQKTIPKVNISFVVDSLLFLKEGGRVSALQAFGANLLNIRPAIKAFTETNGTLDILKKYRGSRLKVFEKYINDLFKNIDNIDNKYVFVAHSGLPNEEFNFALSKIKEKMKFENIFITQSGCTISSHCGKNTIGISFIEK